MGEWKSAASYLFRKPVIPMAVPEKLTASDYKKIGSELSGKTLVDYVKFMQKRFPEERHDSYAREWANRFANATEWNYSDLQSRKVLQAVNAKKYYRVV
jgi:hypothetical protein